MRLLSRLKRLAAGRQVDPSTEAWGLVWTSDEQGFAGEVPAGSHLAIDLYLDPGGSAPSSKYRVSVNPLDLGLVYDVAGFRVGAIVAVEDSRLVLQYDVLDSKMPRYMRRLRTAGAGGFRG